MGRFSHMKVLAAVAVLVVLGMVGFVVVHENSRLEREQAAAGPVDRSAVLTISTGETVNIDRAVPRTGVTIVEFTADF